MGAATSLPYTTVADYLVRARAAGLAWPLPDTLDDAALEARLFSSAGPPAARARPLPDWATVHRELRRTGVTLQLLWIEYREHHPDGYGYTQFVEHYRRWARHLDVVMRHDHRAGEKLFVDYPGATVPIVDPDTGEIRPAQLFVAALDASSYTYAVTTAADPGGESYVIALSDEQWDLVADLFDRQGGLGSGLLRPDPVRCRDADPRRDRAARQHSHLCHGLEPDDGVSATAGSSCSGHGRWRSSATASGAPGSRLPGRASRQDRPFLRYELVESRMR